MITHQYFPSMLNECMLHNSELDSPKNIPVKTLDKESVVARGKPAKKTGTITKLGRVGNGDIQAV